MARSKELTVAAQSLRPLIRLLQSSPEFPAEHLDQLVQSVAIGKRIPISVGRRIIADAVERLDDPDLGLRAALFTRIDDFEVIEWIAASAATWREGCETLFRYARVLNEAAEYRVELCGHKAHVILGTTVALSRQAHDLQLAAFHFSIQHRFPQTWPELEVWMKHDEPADTSLYRAIFPDATLVFRAAFYGFVYDAHRLDTPLPSADAEAYHALRIHADHLLETLAPGDDLVARISADILETLRSGNAAAEGTARRLGMSRRSLVRHLEQRGTAYSELLKEVRYRSAVHYLRNTTHSLEDIAFLLGYSACAPFVRAFKRWSGCAPFEYRRSYGTASPQPTQRPGSLAAR